MFLSKCKHECPYCCFKTLGSAPYLMGGWKGMYSDGAATWLTGECITGQQMLGATRGVTVQSWSDVVQLERVSRFWVGCQRVTRMEEVPLDFPQRLNHIWSTGPIPADWRSNCCTENGIPAVGGRNRPFCMLICWDPDIIFNAPTLLCLWSFLLNFRLYTCWSRISSLSLSYYRLSHKPV